MSENSSSPVLSGDKEHSSYGCSQHPYFAQCPGYRGTGGSNPAADKGNDLHDIAADALAARLQGDTTMLVCVGDELPCGQIYTEQDNMKVEAYVDHCIGLTQQYPDCDKIAVEVPQRMAALGLPEDITTPDFMAIEPFGLCIVVDFKSGNTLVSPTSEQLRSYGLEGYMDNACSSMLCCVSQDGILKTKHYSDAEIRLYQTYMRNMLEMAQWDNPPLIPGKACHRCGRDCPVRKGELQKGMTSFLSVNAEQLGPEQVARFLEVSEILDAATGQMAKIRARGHALEESGIDVPGWHLEPGQSTQVWRNEKEADPVILELFATNTKRVKIDPPPAKGLKTKTIHSPIPASELVIITEKHRSPNQVMELIGKSKDVMDKLTPLIHKVPSSTMHLRRDKPELQGPLTEPKQIIEPTTQEGKTNE